MPAWRKSAKLRFQSSADFSVLMGIQAQFLSADLVRRGPAWASTLVGKPAAIAAAPIPKVFRKCRLFIKSGSIKPAQFTRLYKSLLKLHICCWSLVRRERAAKAHPAIV